MDFKKENNRIYLEDDKGDTLAEITFPFLDKDLVTINKTFVSPALRGQGMAGKLMQEAVYTIESKGWKAEAQCSYAKKWLEKHPEKNFLFIK